MARRQVIMVVDLGFGDAGKGTVVDALVRRMGAHTVVRFNGGAQAGHNVVTKGGRHHTFAQLGAGTFVPGVRTHLSRYVVLHPTALLVEARHLQASGPGDALERLTISEASWVTTPVHQAAARLRELALGEGRHGSCGVGVGETMRDGLADPGAVLRARDLLDVASLRRRLRAQQEQKRADVADEIRAVAGLEEAEPEVRTLEDPRIVDAWIDALGPFRHRELVVPEEATAALLRAPGSVVFEGAQGVLLDEWRGFHPHTTWSTCTFDNALALVREAGTDALVTRLGVLRAYATRHGPGPLPTESPALGPLLDEPHNATGPWQGPFRRGWFDAVLGRYAIAASGGIDGVALTHLDALPRLGRWRGCSAYRARAPDERLLTTASGGEVTGLRLGALRDLDHTAALTRALRDVRPVYEEPGSSAGAVSRWIEDALATNVLVTSAGPTADDKAYAPSFAVRMQ